MTRFVICITFLALFSFSYPVQAQDSTPAHHHPQANVIDGAVHPEFITDLTASRLYLVAVSRPATATDGERRHQAEQIGRIGLQDADRKALLAVLADFDSQYRGVIREFNENATAAWKTGESLDKTSFLFQRDQIVQSTRDTLKSRLTSDGWARFDAHVRGEKKRMKISVMEDGQ